jgi:hypothetical protein
MKKASRMTIKKYLWSQMSQQAIVLPLQHFKGNYQLEPASKLL